MQPMIFFAARGFTIRPPPRRGIRETQAMTLRERIGIDLGRKLPLEEGIAWAASNDVRYVDAQVDIAPNALESFDDSRCNAVRE